MYNRRYEKVFLMLRQEVAGYALSKRPPWGSCIMELKNGKGKLHLTMQGLKPLKNGSYDVYIMAGTESIFCGELQPDRKDGRCELKWEFDPDTVGGNQKAEDFHTVLILAADGNGGFSAPLTAYFKEKRNWKKDFIPRKKEEPKEKGILLQAAEAAVLERPASIIVQEKQEESKDTNAKVAEAQKNSFHGSFQGLLAKFRQELEKLEETGILTPQETENIRNVGTAPAPTSLESKGKIEEMTENICTAVVETEIKRERNLFQNNRELEPFGDGKKWKCLSLEELTLLSQIPLKWQKEFFFLLPYRKYHHLILNETEDGIWLGVPAFYNADDEADAKNFGFEEFRRVDDEWGYWVSFLKWNS